MSFAILTAVLSFALSAAGVGIALHLARKHGWYDRVSARKVHTGRIPRLGGAGFGSAYLIIILFIIVYWGDGEAAGLGRLVFLFVGPLLALLFILLFGIADDFNPLSPRVKLFAQVFAAASVAFAGHAFDRLFYGAGWWDLSIIPGNWAGCILTFLWITGLINALNLIDGVDGLAGGLAALAAATFGVISLLSGGMGFAALLCFALAAAMAGFLVFNLPLPKAKIFMGDGGSQFLGLVLALLPTLGNGSLALDMGSPAGLPLAYAAGVLLIPLFDTISAIWRRLRDHRRIDAPDKAHIHHKLLRMGLSAGAVDAALFGLQIVLSGLTILAVNAYLRGGSFRLSLVLLAAAYLAALGFFAAVHFLSRKVMRGGGGGRRTAVEPRLNP
jgi:UDP-GlcNAc:undecaprenyl-phosphate GlcNAc-1-phosphate transferase